MEKGPRDSTQFLEVSSKFQISFVVPRISDSVERDTILEDDVKRNLWFLSICERRGTGQRLPPIFAVAPGRGDGVDELRASNMTMANP